MGQNAIGRQVDGDPCSLTTTTQQHNNDNNNSDNNSNNNINNNYSRNNSNNKDLAQRPLSSWQPAEVAAWLQHEGFEEAAQAAVRCSLDGPGLLSLDCGGLRESLGVSKLGDLRRLLARLSNLLQQQQQQHAPPVPSQPSAAVPAAPGAASAAASTAASSTPTAAQAQACSDNSNNNNTAVCHVVLDSRNIAKHGSSLQTQHLPDCEQLRLAFDYFSKRQAAETVWICLYRDLAEKWRENRFLAPLKDQWIVTPFGEDVDRFLFAFVQAKEEEGKSALVVTNDCFGNHIRAGHISQDWARRHALKFTLTPDGDFLCPNYRTASTSASSCSNNNNSLALQPSRPSSLPPLRRQAEAPPVPGCMGSAARRWSPPGRQRCTRSSASRQAYVAVLWAPEHERRGSAESSNNNNNSNTVPRYVVDALVLGCSL
ncbi:unnamed protein product, partial [Polarella glacialis]